MIFNNEHSYNCYFGNLSKMLAKLGENITEAELILLSEALNYETKIDSNLFFGFRNDSVFIGLNKIGYAMKPLNNDICCYKEMLSNKRPILLLINACVLDYHTAFLNSPKKHYIVLLDYSNEQIETVIYELLEEWKNRQ